MKCPACGTEATLIGLPAGIYDTSYRCYNRRCPKSGRYGEYNFSSDSNEARAEATGARAASQGEAERIRKS